MANFLYVDNSNIWIEGMHVAAVRDGLAPNLWQAQKNKITAPWKIDFGKLLQFAGGDKADIGRAVLYGSRPPPSDSLWDAAKRKGFDVIVHDKNFAGKEKKVDTNIATDIVADSYEKMKPDRDEVTLVSGDADYVPTVEQLRKRGFRFYVVFWDHASRELKDCSSGFISLNEYLDHLSIG